MITDTDKRKETARKRERERERGGGEGRGEGGRKLPFASVVYVTFHPHPTQTAEHRRGS
jgi:hypothetical protein